jgi:hypothetical protein
MDAPPDPVAKDPSPQARPERYRRIPTWVIVTVAGCAGVLLIIVLTVTVLAGALGGWSTQSEPRAAPGEDLPADELDWLRDGKFIEADEAVLYFSSLGAKRKKVSYGYSRCLVTDRRVLACSAGPSGEVKVVRASYEDIVRADTRSEGIPILRIVIDIETVGGRELTLQVPVAEGRDREFERIFRERWRAGRARAVAGLRADGSMTVERQVEILGRFGIELPSDVSIEDLISARPRADYEQPPFELLLRRLGEIGWDREDASDVLLLDGNRIQESGDFTRFAVQMRNLADGALRIENIADDVTQSRHATLHFESGGQLLAVNTSLEGELIKNSIVREFAAVLIDGTGPACFASAPLRNDRIRVLVCIPREALGELRRETGIDFDWVER